MLRMMAEELVAAVRDTDLVGRLGGDEMGVLLPDCDRDGAVAVAHKISGRLETIRFPGLGAGRRISASIGIVLFPAGDADVRQILANADIARYQAKASGRACWHIYTEGERMQEKLQQRVHRIDRHVIKLVVERLGVLLREGRPYRIAVNLSGVSINDDSLLEFLRLHLARHPDLPRHLIFEITETAAVADFTVARDFMQAVQALGCAFSLDDFGAGFPRSTMSSICRWTT